MRFSLLLLVTAFCLSCGKSSRVPTSTTPEEPETKTPVVRPKTDFEYLGVYLWPSWSREIQRDYDYWKACGYNTVSILIAGEIATEELLTVYHARMRDAQHAGFKVEIVVFSNMGPNGQGFDPRDAGMMQRRLKDIELIVTRMAAADVITLFAGEPGGTPVKLGEAGVDHFMDMVVTVKGIVEKKAPKALYNVNTWAIAHWDDVQISPFTVEFWDKETSFSRKLLANSKWAADIGMIYPMHNYYRSLAMNEYVKAGKTPELFPVQQDVDALKGKGVQRQWAWPYFLVDEVDDGYTGYLVGTHYTQSETRYIGDIARKARGLQLNGMIVNTSIDKEGIQTEALNVYAMGRFSQDASLTAEQVITEFAGFIADSKTAPVLAKVLRFVENQSTWEASIPATYRLQPFADVYPNAQAAMDALATVQANAKPDFPLPFAARGFLDRVKARLLAIK